MDMLKLILAATPVLLLIVLLGFLKIAGDKSALATLVVTLLIALFGFDFSVQNTTLSLILGVLKAIFPILIIIVMAIFSYNVLLYTKKMDIIKHQFSAISNDKCIQVLLLTWGFGGLLEGMAGFGTAVAIPAAILISLGFKPIFSAVSSLIANSVATGFGAVGTPVVTLAKIAEIPNIQQLSTDVVLQLAPLMFLIPFILVYMTDSSLKALPKNIILSLIVGVVSLGVQYGAAAYLGAETPAILGSLASIVVIIAFGKLTGKKDASSSSSSDKYTSQQGLQAWAVYGFILLFIISVSVLDKSIPTFTKSITSVFEFSGISKEGLKTPEFKIGWLNAGFLLFFGTLLGGLVQGAKTSELFTILGKSTIQLQKTIVTVSCLIGLSTVMDFSGMVSILGQGLYQATGSLYPLFAPTIGCLGTFLTGSDTSSNILFGKLQVSVADSMGITDPTALADQRSWLAAANTAGATGGKIISPQSIAVATSACNQQGEEGKIMSKALPYALAYIVIAGLMVYFLIPS